MLSTNTTHSWLRICYEFQCQCHKNATKLELHSSTAVASILCTVLVPMLQLTAGSQWFRHLFARITSLLTRGPYLMLGLGPVQQILKFPPADLQSCLGAENAGYQADQDARQEGAGSQGGPTSCSACRDKGRAPLCSWPHPWGLCWRGPCQSSSGNLPDLLPLHVLSFASALHIRGESITYTWGAQS